MPDERYLSIAEVQRILGVSRQTIYNWIRAGMLKAVKPARSRNGKYLIHSAELRRFLEESARK